jgi:flagellar assembly protein FliH
MSSWSEATPRSIVMRGAEARKVRPARIAADLRSSPFVSSHGADPRLVDPTLEAVVAQAAAAAGDEARAAGWDTGHRAGLEAARREARVLLDAELEAVAQREREERQERAAQWVEALDRLQRAAVELEQRQAPAIEELHHAGAVLAVELAEVLVGHHLTVGDCAAIDAVERALALAPREAAAVVRMHPDDVAALPVLDAVLPGRRVKVVADPGIEPGGCVVDAGERRIDAQLGAAIERVRAVLDA